MLTMKWLLLIISIGSNGLKEPEWMLFNTLQECRDGFILSQGIAIGMNANLTNATCLLVDGGKRVDLK